MNPRATDCAYTTVVAEWSDELALDKNCNGVDDGIGKVNPGEAEQPNTRINHGWPGDLVLESNRNDKEL